MSLFVHLFLHVFTALLAGLVTWFFFGNLLLSFLGGILGGVLIDLDHLIDYFFAFRYRWKLSYFLKGYQFLKSDKIYILFHGWEYLIVIGGLYLIVDPYFQELFFAIGLGSLFHLVVDAFVNHGMTFRGYSFLYRLKRNFDLEKIVTPEHYQEHLKQKSRINF